VKKLKAGKVVALNGISLRYGAPVAGTAYMDFTGAVRIGVLVHSMAPFDAAGNNASVTILGDGTFAVRASTTATATTSPTPPPPGLPSTAAEALSPS